MAVIRSTNGGPIYASFATLLSQLRGALFVRWMHRAQKRALLDWRDRVEPPGLAARFTVPGAAFYGFGMRAHDRARIRKGRPYYVKTGGFRTAILARKPHSKQGSDVVTSIKFGGGALNLFGGIQPVRSVTIETRSGTSAIGAYTYRRVVRSSGATISVSVPAHQGRWTRRMAVLHRGGLTYAQEWGDMTKDRRWIAERVNAVFLTIFKKGTVDARGRLRSDPFRELDEGELEASVASGRAI